MSVIKRKLPANRATKAYDTEMKRIINNAPSATRDAALRAPTQRGAPDPGSPIANLQKAAKRARDEGDLSQAEKFAQAARDLGADQDEEAFKGVLRKLAKPKPHQPPSD